MLVQNTTATQRAQTNNSASSSRLDRDAFMKLLVAQLRNQDPNNSMDAREMITQLSQLTGVEKLTAIETRLESMEVGNAGLSNMQTANLVGRTVEADGSNVTVEALGTAVGRFTLAKNADSVAIKFVAEDGTVVRQVDVGQLNQGLHGFEWDGRNAEGVRVPTGRYHMEISAQTEDGKKVDTSTRISGIVTEVDYEHAEPQLMIGGSPVRLSDVLSIAR